MSSCNAYVCFMRNTKTMEDRERERKKERESQFNTLAKQKVIDESECIRISHQGATEEPGGRSLGAPGGVPHGAPSVTWCPCTILAPSKCPNFAKVKFFQKRRENTEETLKYKKMCEMIGKINKLSGKLQNH